MVGHAVCEGESGRESGRRGRAGMGERFTP